MYRLSRKIIRFFGAKSMNVKKVWNLLPAVLLLCLVMVCSFTYGAAGADNSSVSTFISKSGDREIHFTISEKDITSYPIWSPNKPLPIALDVIFGIAQKELTKYTKGSNGWSAKLISIERVWQARDADKWIYLISFGQDGNHDYIRIPITFSGVPVQGEERSLDKNHWN